MGTPGKDIQTPSFHVVSPGFRGLKHVFSMIAFSSDESPATLPYEAT